MEESCCLGVVEGVGMLDLVLEGLDSCVLFFRDKDPEVDVRLILPGRTGADLVGDESLDARGEGVNDVLADVHLEGCVSMFALEVADMSLSTELRLDRLASMPEGLEVGFAMVYSYGLVYSYADDVVARPSSMGTGYGGCQCRFGMGCQCRHG